VAANASLYIFILSSELREGTEREHQAEAQLERRIVLYGASQVDVLRVLLHGLVRDEMNAVALCCLDAGDCEADQDDERFGEDRYPKASDEAWIELVPVAFTPVYRSVPKHTNDTPRAQLSYGARVQSSSLLDYGCLRVMLIL